MKLFKLTTDGGRTFFCVAPTPNGAVDSVTAHNQNIYGQHFTEIVRTIELVAEEGREPKLLLSAVGALGTISGSLPKMQKMQEDAYKQQGKPLTEIFRDEAEQHQRRPSPNQGILGSR